jgi:hypothetical protein
LLLFFFFHFEQFLLQIYFKNLFVASTFLLANCFTFDTPARSGSRLYRGATCQEYFWLSEHLLPATIRQL